MNESYKAELANSVEIELLGVKYLHLKTQDGGDLYLTKYGIPYSEHLKPENWFESTWFNQHRLRLSGTSLVYKIPTRTINGLRLDLVVKWSRVGETVPLDTLTINKFINAEFNSPFEEFSLLMELRQGKTGPQGIKILTQRPLAIYVPSEKLKLWQTGRSESKIAAKILKHPDVEIDILRQYVLMYSWIKGIDLTEAAELWHLNNTERQEMLDRFTSLAIHELQLKGYRVADMKPQHIIIRPKKDVPFLRNRNGEIVYAIVDYELLERTPEHEEAVRKNNRKFYLYHMAKRFKAQPNTKLPSHLQQLNILGVDYIFGEAESTGGLLWVVGKDPDLFNYFLPERWRRTPKIPLSPTYQLFCTKTKDNIFLVWKISRVGDPPCLGNILSKLEKIIKFGYNSPFEEFSYAEQIAKGGLATVYPRAIYVTGKKSNPRIISDPSRFELFKDIKTPFGEPILTPFREYITIWGFWNGPDEFLAESDGCFYKGVDVAKAFLEKIISEQTMWKLVSLADQRIREIGFEHLRLKPDHLLISFDHTNKILLDNNGLPEIRLCNFELIRPIKQTLPT